jgi:hypothetical protein
LENFVKVLKEEGNEVPYSTALGLANNILEFIYNNELKKNVLIHPD